MSQIRVISQFREKNPAELNTGRISSLSIVQYNTLPENSPLFCTRNTTQVIYPLRRIRSIFSNRNLRNFCNSGTNFPNVEWRGTNIHFMCLSMHNPRTYVRGSVIRSLFGPHRNKKNAQIGAQHNTIPPNIHAMFTNGSLIQTEIYSQNFVKKYFSFYVHIQMGIQFIWCLCIYSYIIIHINV